MVAKVVLSRPFAQRGLVICTRRIPGRFAIVDHEQAIPTLIRAGLSRHCVRMPSSQQPRSGRGGSRVIAFPGIPGDRTRDPLHTPMLRAYALRAKFIDEVYR